MNEIFIPLNKMPLDSFSKSLWKEQCMNRVLLGGHRGYTRKMEGREEGRKEGSKEGRKVEILVLPG